MIVWRIHEEGGGVLFFFFFFFCLYSGRLLFRRNVVAVSVCVLQEAGDPLAEQRSEENNGKK